MSSYLFEYKYVTYSSDIPHYRNLFNGQEADNEVYGEGALHAFEYRMHDTRIGRFWSVDPLSAKFPWNSPYAFAENRVIDGQELEGLEYLGANESRLQFMHGEVHLKVSNFYWINQIQWKAQSDNPANWTTDPKTGRKDIGVNTLLAPLSFKQTNIPIAHMDNTYGATDPSVLPTNHYINNPRTKKSNYTVTDNRYKQRVLSGATPVTAKGASAILVVDVLNTAFVGWLGLSAYVENNIINKQKKYINYVVEDMNKALSDKNNQYIPQKYMNVESLSNIMNVILQGENNTSDPAIKEIGMRIYNNISKQRKADD